MNSRAYISKSAILFIILLFALFHKITAQESTQKRELVNNLIDNNEIDSAILILFEILAESPKDSIVHQGKVLNQIGRLQNYNGEYQTAFNTFIKSQEKYKDGKNEYLQKRVNQNLANACFSMGQTEKALNYLHESLEYWKAEKDSTNIISILLDMGLVYYRTNQPELALKCYLEIVNLPYNDISINKAKAYNQMGNISATNLKDDRRALNYYLKSLSIKEQLDGNFTKSIINSYGNIGVSYKVMGDFDSAVYFYKKAIEKGRESNERVATIEPLNNISNIYKRQNKMEEAEEALLEAYEYINQSSLQNQTLINTSLGILYNEIHLYDKALEYLKTAQELAEKSQNLPDIADVHEFMIDSYLGLNQLENAKHSLETLLDIKDSISGIYINNSVADMMVKYETNEKEMQLLEKDLLVKRRTTWFLASLAILILILSFLYIKFRKKEALAKQAILEISLHEQVVKNKIQEERLRISRELHDNIGSHLTLINAMTEEFDESDSKAKKVRKSILLSMKELRKTVWLLNKESNTIDEIVIKLRNFLSNTRDNAIRINILPEGNTNARLNDIETTHFFRTIQEAVNNAIKYSNCSEIEIKMKINSENEIDFSVKDNGKGFEKAEQYSSNGLANMQYRIEQLGGNLSIESIINQGTTVSGNFKLSNQNT